MALCSYSDVEAIVGIDFSSTVQTSITNNFIAYSDRVIKTYIGYDIEQSNQTEVLFGNNMRELSLKHLPVNSITSVTEDGNVLTEGNDNEYVFHENGRLERVLGRWSGSKPRNITIVYNAGYSTIPEDIRFTSARISARMVLSALNLGSQAKPGAVDTHLSDSTDGADMSVVLQERIGDLTVQFADPLAYFDGDLLKSSDKLLLSPYKKQVLV
jgi:hypothetical protein|tara:strand:+ start:53 stop:691 length:639 start_codon:yes stop_codon:yes gene_type:complete